MVLAVVVGCGEPTPLPCNNDLACGGGACIEGFCAVPDGSCSSGLRYHESAGALAGECAAGSGDGSGSGGGSGLPVTGEIEMLGDVTVIDASTARDDIKPSCAVTGGRDVMFDVTIRGSQRLYVDTFGTSYGVVLAVYSGTCAVLTPQSFDAFCVATSCNATTMQWSEVLAAGDYCVVVDQSVPNAPAGQLVVRSKVGPPSPVGNLFNRTNLLNIGSTCAPDQMQASCNPASAGEVSWFFMTCGGTLNADTCDDADYQGYLTAFGLGAAPLACTDGCVGPSINTTLAAPSPLWIVADDVASTSCAQVAVYVTLQ